MEWALFLCEKLGGVQLAKFIQEFDTIAAISTPPGEGAISIVRLSGEEALPIAAKVFRSGQKNLQTVPSHTIHYYSLIQAV